LEALESWLATSRNGWFLAAALAVIAAPWVLRAPLRRFLDRRRITRAVRSLGAKCAHNLQIADGLDGTAFVDHLVMTPACLLVVNVKRYPGAIFGASNVDQWAQVMREGSYKFPNPLAEVQELVSVVRGQLPDVPVEGVVLFDKDSSFPKGKPDGVLHVPDIDPRRPRPPLSQVPEALQQAWARLCPEA